jgi:hypothetical protein
MGRVRSTSYAPREGAAHTEMIDKLNALFERYAQDGEVTMVYRVDVYVGDNA